MDIATATVEELEQDETLFETRVCQRRLFAQCPHVAALSPPQADVRRGGHPGSACSCWRIFAPLTSLWP